jgi:hypothetical protein
MMSRLCRGRSQSSSSTIEFFLFHLRSISRPTSAPRLCLQSRVYVQYIISSRGLSSYSLDTRILIVFLNRSERARIRWWTPARVSNATSSEAIGPTALEARHSIVFNWDEIKQTRAIDIDVASHHVRRFVDPIYFKEQAFNLMTLARSSSDRTEWKPWRNTEPRRC